MQELVEELYAELFVCRHMAEEWRQRCTAYRTAELAHKQEMARLQEVNSRLLVRMMNITINYDRRLRLLTLGQKSELDQPSSELSFGPQ